jgi:hypothetical protein
MLPVLEAGGAGIEEFRRKAREMGFSLSGETADAADALGTQIEVLQDQFGRIAVAIGEALLPVANAFVAVMQGLVGRVIQFIRENQGLVLGVTAAGVALLGVGTAIGIVGAGLVTFGVLISTTSTVLGALAATSSLVATAFAGIVPAATAAWAAVTGPVFLAVAGVLTLGAAIAYATGLLGAAAASFSALWDVGVETASGLVAAWQGVTDAIAADDWSLAGEIAVQGLEVAIRRGLEGIVSRVVIPFAAKVYKIIGKIPGLGSVADFGAALSASGGLIDFGGSQAQRELDELTKRAREARRDASPASRPIEPDDIAPSAPALPELPGVDAPALPDLAPAQAEIQTRLSAMGGFNAAALGGMFGDSGSKIEEHTKKSAEYLQKLLEQGKRQRDALVWS